MKVNVEIIEKIINVKFNVLNYSIIKFKQDNGYDPILLVSHDTFHEMITKNLDCCKIEVANTYYTMDVKYLILYNGCKIFIDNSIPENEVELR